MKRDYIAEYYDYKKYEEAFNKIVNNDDEVNIKVAKIAYFMVMKFPKLPYFWGGGHNQTKKELIGLDHEWGKLVPVIDYGSDNYIVGKYYPKSFDCSGFVTWCLVNAGYDLDKYIDNPNIDYSLNSKDFLKLGDVCKINDEEIINKVKLGDLAYRDGHIGVICDIDYDKETIKVAHISYQGRGSNLTTISLITSRVIQDNLGLMGNNRFVERLGNIYFTDIILVNY